MIRIISVQAESKVMVAIKEVNENELSENGGSPSASPGPHVGSCSFYATAILPHSCYFAGWSGVPSKKRWASDVSQAKTFHTGNSQQTKIFHPRFTLMKKTNLFSIFLLQKLDLCVSVKENQFQQFHPYWHEVLHLI